MIEEFLTKEQLEIIDNYKTTFIEDYNDWKTIVSTINTNLYNYIEVFESNITEKNSMDIDKLNPFTYNEFCDEFITQLKRYFEEFETLTQEAIASIFEVIIVVKLSKTTKYPADMIQLFLS